jgi:hypothetical protein
MGNQREKLDSSCIFQSQKEKIDLPKSESYFTLIGMQDYQDDKFNPRLKEENSKTFAKSIYIPDGNITRFYIKIDSRGKLYNPSDIYKDDNKQHQFINKVCKETSKYKDVNPKIFDMYLNFLRTKIESWLNNAEREMI